MQCREAVFSEDVLEYFVGNYRGEQYVQEVYNPDCYIPIDNHINLFGKNNCQNLYAVHSTAETDGNTAAKT